jgi:hypothetical protein
MRENGELYNQENTGNVAMTGRNVNDRKWLARPLMGRDRVPETLPFPLEFADFDLDEASQACRCSREWTPAPIHT